MFRKHSWILLAITPFFSNLAANAAERPKLVVLLVIDQFRGDYLSRWQNQFRKDGFRRLLDDGAWFNRCHYPYAITMTAAGHASISTGCAPWRHGIVGNDWYQPESNNNVYATSTDRYFQVPAPGGKEVASSSPERLLVPTVWDDAREHFPAGSLRVFSVSIKDRSAVLLGGKKPEGCYWFETDTGEFVTSTYYRSDLPAWVRSFNASHVADQWFNKDWTRFRDDLDYEALSGPDNHPGEGTGKAQGTTFPHPMNGGDTTPGPKYYDALTYSPFGNDLLIRFVLSAIEGEKIGQTNATDVLCISFSSNDLVGHTWGPDSQEVLDTTLRSDAWMSELLGKLDETVGVGNYLIALSADHGVCPLPEVAREQGHPSGRPNPAALIQGANQHLAKLHPTPKPVNWIASAANSSLAIQPAVVKELGLDHATIVEELAQWLREQDWVQAAVTYTQVFAPEAEKDPFLLSVRKSFHPERRGDIAVVPKPYYFVIPYLTGTTHGTSHEYDTHVPLLVFGTNVKPGIRDDAVTPQAAAAIVGASLGVPHSPRMEAEIPKDLFQTR
ncbi:MAG: alkaline phosphatase family protein [Planctomycetota bacterium]